MKYLILATVFGVVLFLANGIQAQRMTPNPLDRMLYEQNSFPMEKKYPDAPIVGTAERP